MLFLPKFSHGSEVIIEEYDCTGVITGIEATLKVGKSGKQTYKAIYFVEIEDVGTKKLHENQLKDVPTIKPESEIEMDKFLADSLLLTMHDYPNKKIEETIKQLLGIKATGGASYEGS